MKAKEIDKHLKEFEWKDTAGLNEAVIRNIVLCQAWAYIRPIIMFIRPLLNIKRGWRIAIDIAVAAFDKGCEIEK